jgi:hypothetical protein
VKLGVPRMKGPAITSAHVDCIPEKSASIRPPDVYVKAWAGFKAWAGLHITTTTSGSKLAFQRCVNQGIHHRFSSSVYFIL